MRAHRPFVHQHFQQLLFPGNSLPGGGRGGKSTSKVVLNFGYVVKVTALEEELWLSKAVRKLFKYPKIASIRSA